MSNTLNSWLSPIQINQYLWKHDLMGTGCNLMDEMEDEYLAIADSIHQRLQSGEELTSAVIAVFEQSFWSGCLSEGTRTDCLGELLKDMQSHS